MTEKKRTTRAPSSLKFLSGVLATNSVLAAFWISVPASNAVKAIGLVISFIMLVVVSKSIWEYKLDQYRAPEEIPEVPSISSEELQKFVVDQLQFAVVSVGPELEYRLETKTIPAAMGSWRMWERKELGELLRSVTSLSNKDIDLLKFHLRLAFGMDQLQWHVTSLGLPREAQLKVSHGHYVRLSYVPQFEEGLLANVRLIMQDISEIKQREEQANAQRKEMEKFFALLQVSDSLFELFMGETRRLFEDIRNDLKQLKTSTPEAAREHASRLFRAVHTIKANARLFKLDSIQDVAHHVETYLDDLRQGKIKINPNTLQELTLRMQSISEEVYSYASLRKEILNTTDRNSGNSAKRLYS
ncbi:MAG: hypothetical protein EOP07_19565 [Proteobacteria bacterium]|nr:MAG: hypothetical protein EOP07_19565 [Pseudomonadota bacterium]